MLATRFMSQNFNVDEVQRRQTKLKKFFGDAPPLHLVLKNRSYADVNSTRVYSVEDDALPPVLINDDVVDMQTYTMTFRPSTISKIKVLLRNTPSSSGSMASLARRRSTLHKPQRRGWEAPPEW